MTEQSRPIEHLASYIDHTLLAPGATRAQIKAVCEEAKSYHTASVCVNPCWAGFIAKELEGSGVKPCVVVGFPLGATPSACKANEAATAILDGAKEVDMVINIGYAKGGEWDLVQSDITAVAAACKGKALLKVIIETCLLSDEEKVKACQAAVAAGADFVKTSTGFSTGGAKVEDVALMRKTVGPKIGVKASGGIHSRAEAEAMIAAGATRIGASSTKKIVD